MHYAYDIVIAAANTYLNPAVENIKLTAGVIRHVSFIFPAGCARYVRCCLWDNAVQLLPTNPDSSYCEDNYSVEADCYIKIANTGNEFHIVGWNVGSQYAHTIHVLVDVEGVDEPTPDKSVVLLAESINNLVQFMRSWF
jgi:hypothetical protein